MSRAQVRQAVVDFFAPPAVPYLSEIYRAVPKRIPGPEFRKTLPSGTYSGAIAIVNLTGEREERIAIGGEHNGRKWVHYEVVLELKLHSIHTHSEDAMDDFDALVDAIKTKLRSDRRLANNGVIFEAGEAYLDTDYAEPEVMNDGSTIIWGIVRFEVSEVLAT